MSPEKVTIIDRDGWGPIVSKTFPEEVREQARLNIESLYNEIGIIFNLKEVTFIDLYM